MQKIAKLIPSIVWVIAAAVVFPLFLPNGYNVLLFGGRLAAAVAFLGLAYVAFRTRAQWLVPQLVASVVALGVGNYVSAENFKLIKPSEAHILALVREGLEKQGPQAVAEYTDLSVSGETCEDANRADWDCAARLSYKVASTGKIFEQEPLNLRINKGTGKVFEMIAAQNCELDFQWTQRFRKSPYYSPELEPVQWSSCDPNRENTAYVRSLSLKQQGGWGQPSIFGLKFLLTKNDRTAPLTLEPFSLYDAATMIKDSYGDGGDAQCDYTPGNPLEVRCKVQTEKVMWEGNVATMSNPLGGSTQMKQSVTETVSIVPQGDRWGIKK